MSTRLLVTECFEGNHGACSGCNGPPSNPNYYCDCPCHAGMAKIESACNALLLDIYDLSTANAPISPEYARQTADCVGQRVGQIRQVVDAIKSRATSAKE